MNLCILIHYLNIKNQTWIVIFMPPQANIFNGIFENILAASITATLVQEETILILRHLFPFAGSLLLIIFMSDFSAHVQHHAFVSQTETLSQVPAQIFAFSVADYFMVTR